MPNTPQNKSPKNLPPRTPRVDAIVSEAGEDPYRLIRSYPEPTACSSCGSIYREGRWTWGSKADAAGANMVVCPACRRIKDEYFAGELIVSGAFVASHRDDVVATLRAEAEEETREHPLHRIGRMEELSDRVLVWTTDVHLARRLGEALNSSYKGSLKFDYPKGDETIRVEWERLDAHAPAPSPVAKQIPIEILASGLAVGPEVETYVRERLAKLDRFNSRMQACRVTIEAPTGHHKQGGPFDVSIKIEVPGPDIIVNRQQAKDLHVAIRFAFDAAQRMMEDQVRKMRAEEPRTDDRTFGTVVRIFPQEGYGFLQAADGHEVYFHRNSVVGAELEALAVGARVRFAEEPGDNGPQATSVVP